MPNKLILKILKYPKNGRSEGSLELLLDCRGSESNYGER
jgi:hypothetical protein